MCIRDSCTPCWGRVDTRRPSPGAASIRPLYWTRPGCAPAQLQDVEVEPWDEPDEGEKLRASAQPPESAERKARARARARSRASGRILSSRPRSCCPSPSPSSRPSTSSYTRRSGASRRWSTTGTGATSQRSSPRRAPRGSRSAPRGKKGKAQAKGRERAKHAAWREAVRFVAASQDGAGAFLNAIPG